MSRPCFLVVDREYPGSISTRKLVIETAKLNVITAYSAVEALELLKRFPAVDGAVLDLGVNDMAVEELIAGMKEQQPGLPVVAIQAPGSGGCPEADYELDSFQPSKLLEILQRLQPKATAEIEKHDEELSVEQKPLSSY